MFYGCLFMGKIGFVKIGVVLFNLLIVESYNVVEGSNVEIFDSCDGYVINRGEYYYYKIFYNCLYSKGVDEFLGIINIYIIEKNCMF